MITLPEAKSMLKISDTSRDSFLTFHIPIVIEVVCNYCKNHFLDKNIYIKDSGTIFEKTDSSIIIPNFSNELIPGDYIRIFESTRNNGHAKIDSIDGNKLTISDKELVTETISNNIIIFRVNYPNPLKIGISKMLQTLINNDDPNLVKEKVDDYEAVFKDSEGDFPKDLMKAFRRYKQFYLEEIDINEY
jgi:hypothetical protein